MHYRNLSILGHEISFSLIFFLVVLSSSPGVHPLIKTPPLFICDGATNDLDNLIPSCPNICKVPETSSTPTPYQLYESVITTDSYIARCLRVRASKMFYESYFFTRSASETVKTNLPPMLDNCTQIFKEVCKLRECSTPEPQFTDEFRWGKDREVVLEYHLVLASMKSVPISIDQSDPKILINKDMVPISDGHYRPPNENVIYLWDKDMTNKSEQCPFEKSPDVIGCYPADEMLWCPDLGVYLEVAKVFTDKRCSDDKIMLSTSGILYAKSTSPINVTHHNIIPLPSDSNKESEALLASINSWIYRLDHTECLTSCLQSRQPGIHIIGQQSLKSNGHKYTLCSKTVACRLMEPLTICSRPFLVKVMCGTGQYWWNPGQEFVEPVSECKDLLSKLPSSETHIGVIKMNRSGVYYMPTAFMSEIPSTLKGYINVESWITHAKDIKLDFQPHQEIREQQVPFSRMYTNDEHRSWLGEIWDTVTGFPRFIKNKFHEISDWIKTISVVIVCGFVVVYLLVRYLRVTRALKSKLP